MEIRQLTIRTFFLYLLLLGPLLVTRGQNENALIYQANKAYGRNKIDEAIIDYQKAVSNNPKNVIARYNLGNALFRKGNFAQAERSYSEALKNTSLSAARQRTLYNLGVSLSQQKKLEESIDAYKKALILNPSDEDCRFNLQKALEELRKQKKPEDKPNNRKKQPQDKPREQKKQPPPNKRMLQQWLQALRQKEQEVQKKMQESRSRGVKQPDKDW